MSYATTRIRTVQADCYEGFDRVLPSVMSVNGRNPEPRPCGRIGRGTAAAVRRCADGRGRQHLAMLVAILRQSAAAGEVHAIDDLDELGTCAYPR